MQIENVVVSPCSNPEMELEEVLQAYSALGYKKFEVFTSWVKSAFDYTGEPELYIEKGKRYSMSFASFHLPHINDDIQNSLKKAIQAAHFAKALGVKVVIYKANSRANYIKAGKSFLGAIEGLDITPVLQNHAGMPISTLRDYAEVLEGINDERMKTLLEVGHFHAVGVSWREGYNLLRDQIALVHIKDMIGAQPVPFGTGEVDLPGLFRHMCSVGYTGDYVVEMEVDRQNQKKTLHYLKEALEYLKTNCLEEENE